MKNIIKHGLALSVPALSQIRPDLTRDDCFNAIRTTVLRTLANILQEIYKFSSDKDEAVKLFEVVMKRVVASAAPSDLAKMQHQNMFLAIAYYEAKGALKYLNNSDVELALKSSEIANLFLGMYQRIIKNEDLNLVIRNYQKAPKEKHKKSSEFWRPYQEKFDEYIADGKKEAWALNKIGDLIEREGCWNKLSRKGQGEILTRPDRGTLRRQLVTNRI